MVINIDCVKDVLIYLQDQLEITVDEEGYVTTDNITIWTLFEAEELREYSKSEVFYAVKKLDEVDFIRCSDFDEAYGDGMLDPSNVCISDITIDGHDFISKITINNVWEKSKNIMKKLGRFSFEIGVQVLSCVATEHIQNIIG